MSPSLRPALLVVAALSLGDAVMRLTFSGRSVPQDSLLWVLDASRETSLPTWFSVVAMACAGLCCLRRSDADWRWRIVGLGCLYLSADDACMLHERIGAVAAPWLGGHGVYSWVMTLGVLFALGGAAVFAWVWRTLGPGAPRRSLCAGFAALAVALALEVIEDRVIAGGATLRGIPWFFYDSWLEETLEMLGPVLLWPAFSAPPRQTA